METKNKFNDSKVFKKLNNGHIIQKSYLIGLIIGTRYCGVGGRDWNYNIVDEFKLLLKKFIKNKSAFYNSCRCCNCGNGRCLHIIDISLLLEQLIDIKLDINYGDDFDEMIFEYEDIDKYIDIFEEYDNQEEKEDLKKYILQQKEQIINFIENNKHLI